MTAAIRVEGLGKSYRVAHNQPRAGYRTLRESLMAAVAAPFRRWANGGEAVTTEQFWALKDVSFEVQPGEVVGIIGRNGAGKSTLLKVLSRITKPTKGRVELNGRVGSLLEVGTGFHPELTGRENIYLNGSILGMSRKEIDRRFDEIVAFAEIEKFLDTPVKRYSSGMYVRLAFAVAAHLEPEILIVDEVLAVGDAQFQKKCIGKMEDVARRGRTVLFVSHNTTALLELCERGIHIASGLVTLDDNIRSVVENYLSDAIVSADGRFDLTRHIARAPHHRPIIREIILRDARGSATTSFRSMDPLVVDITVNSTMPIRDPRIAVAVEDSLGRRLLTVASYLANVHFDVLSSAATYRCHIPELALGEGRYLISVSAATKHGGLIDSVDGAAWFDVRWNNNYGNGEPYYPIYGPVFVQSTWEQLHDADHA
jgi:homopolymeric O-antigen transport system ATP-binding protein